MLDSALYYSKLGYSVLPVHYTVGNLCSCGNRECQSKGKHPLTRAGLNDASKDPHMIESWWREHPKANIGVRTGVESDLTVLDFDGEDGHQSFKDYLEAILPLTRTHSSPNGFHLFYSYTPDLRQTAGILTGVDIRSDGGYIIMPPSVVLGRPYTVIVNSNPNAIDNVPTVLIKKLVTRTNGHNQENTHSPNWVVESLKGVSAGQRNATAARLIGYFHRKMLPQNVIIEIMDLWASRCNPPMPFDELDNTVRSVTRYLDDNLTIYEGDDRHLL